MSVNENEKAIIAVYDTARSDWAISSRKVLEELNKNSEESRKKAVEITLGEASGKFEVMRDQLNTLTELNLANAEKASSEATSSYRMSMSMLTATIIIGVVLGIILAGVIGLVITKPIHAAIASLRGIAQGEGDLTRQLAADRKDEVGELSIWFNTFLKKLQVIIREVAENAGVVESRHRKRYSSDTLL